MSWAERGRGLPWLLGIILLLVAATAFTLGLRGQQPSLGGPVVTAGKPAGTPGVKPAARSVPVGLSIPAINLLAQVSELGLNPNRTVQVPANFQEPGWYKFGPSPGQVGSSVILVHVAVCPDMNG